jgi:hypothetical protein
MNIPELNLERVSCENKEDFPTPESPSNMILHKESVGIIVGMSVGLLAGAEEGAIGGEKSELVLRENKGD